MGWRMFELVTICALLFAILIGFKGRHPCKCLAMVHPIMFLYGLKTLYNTEESIA